MKDLILKLIVLKIISILILSQIVFAQNSFEDSFNDDDTQASAANSAGFGFDEGSNDERFRDEIRDDDERYEFREKRVYGYEKDFGPEYENKEEMLFGRLFHLIEDDINEFEIMKLCGEPEKIADITIGKIKAKIGDISNACEDIELHETECKERAEKDCSRIGKPDLRFARDEREKKQMQAFACPPNKELMVELCVEDSRGWIDDRLQYLEEDCEIEWERYGGANDPECQRLEREQFCDESRFIEQCLKRYEPFDVECPDVKAPECPNGNLENKYDDKGCLIGYSCIEFEKQCPITEEDALRMENDCFKNNGQPERIYDNKCVVEVRCNIKSQCPMPFEEAERLYNDCLAKNGNPEKIWDGDCIKDVICVEKSVCGNNICEDGEADDCPVCEPGDIICSKRPCIIGTCPEDCKDKSADSSGSQITGAFTYDQAKDQCEKEWSNQQDYCRDLKQRCNKDAYVDACIAREKKNIEFNLEDSKRQCERDANTQIRHQERECSRMDFERTRCLEEGSRQCTQMEGLASECHATMTEENFRAFIIREAEKRCKFVPFIKKDKDFSKYEKMEIVLAVLDTVSEEEIAKLESIVEGLNKKFELDGKILFDGMISPNRFVDIKNLNFVVDAKLNAPESSEISREKKLEIISRLDFGRVVEKLLELRDTDISSEYKYLVEDKASDLLEAADEIDEVEEKEETKGFGYKIKLFLGLAKDLEENEIQSLERSKERLETSIATLSKLAETVPDDIAKAILKAQVEDLENQKADIDDLIEQKKRKAKGLLGLFGLFG